jgi:hypothetical protein
MLEAFLKGSDGLRREEICGFRMKRCDSQKENQNSRNSFGDGR